MSEEFRLPERLAIVNYGLLHSMAKDRPWFCSFLQPSKLVGSWQASDGLLAWGLKPGYRRATNLAQKHGLGLIRMEDAFLRSVYFGMKHKPMGFAFDDTGIYYDASQPSRLERLISAPLEKEQIERTSLLIRQWREGHVSKYNHASEFAGPLPESFVLVIDQTAGDLSINYGCANAASFGRMIEAALDENPTSAIVLKIHPEVAAGRKRGHYDLGRLRRSGRVVVVADDVHPVRLISEATAVYTVTSQVGFEALIWGKMVRTFGLPFYAGWGLTEDDCRTPHRRSQATIHQLVHAALVTYPRYVDQRSGRRCEVEAVIAHLADERKLIGNLMPARPAPKRSSMLRCLLPRRRPGRLEEESRRVGCTRSPLEKARVT